VLGLGDAGDGGVVGGWDLGGRGGFWDPGMEPSS